MAKRAASQPAWTLTVAAWRDSGHACMVGCSDCKLWRPVDLERVIAAKGPDYSLWNRRVRCGCGAHVIFYYGGRGPLRPARDDGFF